MIPAGKISTFIRLLLITAFLSWAPPLTVSAQVSPALSSEAGKATEAAVDSLKLQTEIPKAPSGGRGRSSSPSNGARSTPGGGDASGSSGDQGGDAASGGQDGDSGSGGRDGLSNHGNQEGGYPPDSWDKGYPSEGWDADYHQDGWGEGSPLEGRGRNYEPRQVEGRSSSATGAVGGLLGFIAKLLLWVSVAVIVGIIAMALYEHLRTVDRSRQLERREGPEIESGTAETLVCMDQSQNEADELARKGFFAEAMHVLLLRSVSEMRRLDVSIAESLTSREILGRIGLSPEGRRLFADIIGRVEISYFGLYKPGADEYLACRRSFEMLSGVLGRGAGR